MTHEAEVTMMLYQSLSPEEETVVKRLENDVMRLLRENGITSRPMWIGRTGTNTRFLQLCVSSTMPPAVLLQLPSNELATLSQSALLSQLKDSLIERMGT